MPHRGSIAYIISRREDIREPVDNLRWYGLSGVRALDSERRSDIPGCCCKKPEPFRLYCLGTLFLRRPLLVKSKKSSFVCTAKNRREGMAYLAVGCGGWQKDEMKSAGDRSQM
jgi:hypothetical protein